MVVAGCGGARAANRIGGLRRGPAVELDLRADALDAAFGAGRGRRSTTVYLGGGTPSLLPADDVARLLDRSATRFGSRSDAEITLEANPGPDERGDPAALRAAGVTRLSFGAQALTDAELRRLGRRHRAARRGATPSPRRATAGIGSVSLDLLYDVPDADARDLDRRRSTRRSRSSRTTCRCTP